MSEMYQLKITLGRYKPPVWRRVIVDPTLSSRQLHGLIQILFNWSNSNLHKFQRASYGRDYYRLLRRRSGSGLDESKSIEFYLNEPKQKLDYVYDFGDPWDHQIELEKTVPKEDARLYPYCVTGRCSGPLEDRGGCDEDGEPIEYTNEEIAEIISRKLDVNALNRKIQANRVIFTHDNQDLEDFYEIIDVQ